MIQDTSFVIDLLDGDDRALELLGLIEDERRPEKLSAITVLELHEGIRRSERPADERSRVLDVLDSKSVVPADGGIMRHAGTLSGDLYAAGSPIDREDCIVAATALAEGEPVVTGNPGHFDRIDGLDVRSY